MKKVEVDAVDELKFTEVDAVDELKFTEEVLSIKSQGYNQAVAGDTIANIAKWCMRNINGFPVKNDVPNEARDLLYQGYRLRRNECYKPEPLTTDFGREQLVTVDMAYSYSSVGFGKLKNDQPLLYNAIKEVRKATDWYCSKNFSRLLAKGLELQNEDKPRGKRATLSFSEQVKKSFDLLDGKAKLMATREVENKVMEERYKNAVIAFNRVWNDTE